MLVIALGVSYILDVPGAATQKRAFAGGITELGETGIDIPQTNWNGEEFTGARSPTTCVDRYGYQV